MRAASLGSCVTTTRLVPSSRLSSSMSANTCSALRAIEIAGGLVGEYQLRRGHQRARHRGALPLAAGELVRLVIETLLESDARQQRARARRGRHRAFSSHQQRHRHVLQRRELGQQVVKLVDEADAAIAQCAAVALRQRVNVLPRHQYLARVGTIEAAENLQQRGLAGSGCADDCQPFATRSLPARLRTALRGCSSPRGSGAARRARSGP